MATAKPINMLSKEKIEPQPFVKWAGGKRWLAAHIKKIKPKGWNGRYFGQ
jgi:hypothetical protein